MEMFWSDSEVLVNGEKWPVLDDSEVSEFEMGKCPPKNTSSNQDDEEDYMYAIFSEYLDYENSFSKVYWALHKDLPATQRWEVLCCIMNRETKRHGGDVYVFTTAEK